MEQLPSDTLRTKLIEYKKDEIYFLAIIAKTAVDASRIDSGFNGTNTIEYYQPPETNSVIIKINLMDYNQYYYIDIILNENSNQIMSMIDNNKITHLVVYYPNDNRELVSYGHEHPLTF